MISGQTTSTRLPNDLASGQRRFHNGSRPSYDATTCSLPIHQRSHLRRLPRRLHARRYSKRSATLSKTHFFTQQTENLGTHSLDSRLHEPVDEQSWYATAWYVE